MANGSYTCDLDQLDVNFSFGEPFSEPYFTGRMTGQRTKEWSVGCVENGGWTAIRAIRRGGKYQVWLQYSLLSSGRGDKPGWYCVEQAGWPDRVPCKKLLGLSASSNKISNWFGDWYFMDGG